MLLTVPSSLNTEFLLQPWEDEELTTALAWLEGQLTESVRLLSSFERYKKEVAPLPLMCSHLLRPPRVPLSISACFTMRPIQTWIPASSGLMAHCTSASQSLRDVFPVGSWQSLFLVKLVNVPGAMHMACRAWLAGLHAIADSG